MENIENKKETRKESKISYLLKEWVLPIVVAFVLFKIITTFVFFNSQIPSESMYPTLQVSDRLFTWRIFDREKVERGDIVVFEQPNNDKDLFVKRVIGLPGDMIKLETNGDVYVNGELLEEPYVKNQIDAETYEKGLYTDANGYEMNLGTYEVPESHVFLIGDNRSASLDARYWEDPYISMDAIEGKPLFRMWPFSRFGKVE